MTKPQITKPQIVNTQIVNTQIINPQIGERLLRWVAVPALAAVLVGLAVLQYRWSGQVSDATRAQMQSNLHISLMGFRQDFAREMGAVAAEIRSGVDGSSSIKPAELKEQFHHWQQTAAHPNLVSHIYLWQYPTSQQPLRFDPSSDQFQRMAWPVEFGPLRQRLLEIMMAYHPPLVRGHAMGARGKRPRHSELSLARSLNAGRRNTHADTITMHGHPMDAFIPWAVDQSIPALAYPVRRHAIVGDVSSPVEVTWLIIQLNPEALEKEIFPELAQKYFRGSSGMEYHVAVRVQENDQRRVLYVSDAGFGEDNSVPVDATVNLIGPPFGHGGPADPGHELFAAPMPAQGQHGPSSHDPLSEDRRATAPERLPRFEPVRYSGNSVMWQISAKHKSGSVEAAVGGLRRRNLMASFGVLGVLAITMGLILVASQRARKLARLQMDFVAGISHELRTPLAVISSAAENIAHGVIEDRQQLLRYGNSIVKQSRQLAQLVEQVLLFASTQQAQRRYDLGALNIIDVVDAALDGTAGIVATAGFTVDRRMEDGLPMVSGDFNALVQSVQNLITNAVKYGGEKPWLRISARSVQDKGHISEVELAVEDQGLGISKEELKHIFEPFYRSPAVSQSGIHGTGLGLPLARTIVEAMGGRLTATSEPGKGSTFSMYLQVAKERALEVAQPAAEKHAGAEPDFPR